ncbi:pentapeptide repeat-containing protein [Actinomadura vinacea]|uniref:pentapeptide repeat-containing protein n=1 Tax=Actinomadura vinacea TaxID=115336 RepID=UPI0031DDEF88
MGEGRSASARGSRAHSQTWTSTLASPSDKRPIPRWVRFVSSERVDRADLWGADLVEADLDGATLDRADLRDADLAGADLRGTLLNLATLQGADLFRCCRCCVPPTQTRRADPIHGAAGRAASPRSRARLHARRDFTGPAAHERESTVEAATPACCFHSLSCTGRASLSAASASPWNSRVSAN